MPRCISGDDEARVWVQPHALAHAQDGVAAVTGVCAMHHCHVAGVVPAWLGDRTRCSTSAGLGWRAHVATHTARHTPPHTHTTTTTHTHSHTHSHTHTGNAPQAAAFDVHHDVSHILFPVLGREPAILHNWREKYTCRRKTPAAVVRAQRCRLACLATHLQMPTCRRQQEARRTPASTPTRYKRECTRCKAY